MDKKLKYYDLMEDLRKQIVSGKIKPGEKMPSENELSGTYQVSRQTVRKALQILQNEGYIYAEHGRGTFCSEMARRTGETKNIAVVTTYLSDYIFPRVIQGIDKVLTENGYSILLKNTRNSRNMEAKCLEERQTYSDLENALRSGRSDGGKTASKSGSQSALKTNE